MLEVALKCEIEAHTKKKAKFHLVFSEKEVKLPKKQKKIERIGITLFSQLKINKNNKYNCIHRLHMYGLTDDIFLNQQALMLLHYL